MRSGYATRPLVQSDVPGPVDMLASYQRDVLAALRWFLTEVEELSWTSAYVLGDCASSLETLGQAGHALTELAYGDDGELLDPLSEEMVEAIDNGIVPDLEDAREQVTGTIRELTEKLRASIAAVDGILVPLDETGRVTPARRRRGIRRGRR